MLVSQQRVKKKKRTKPNPTLDVRTQTECAPKKGEEVGCQTAALNPPINVNKKVAVKLTQSRAKRPLLCNTIHAHVHVCLAGVYTTRLGGTTVGCFQFSRKSNLLG